MWEAVHRDAEVESQGAEPARAGIASGHVAMAERSETGIQWSMIRSLIRTFRTYEQLWLNVPTIQATNVQCFIKKLRPFF